MTFTLLWVKHIHQNDNLWGKLVVCRWPQELHIKCVNDKRARYLMANVTQFSLPSSFRLKTLNRLKWWKTETCQHSEHYLNRVPLFLSFYICHLGSVQRGSSCPLVYGSCNIGLFSIPVCICLNNPQLTEYRERPMKNTDHSIAQIKKLSPCFFTHVYLHAI